MDFQSSFRYSTAVHIFRFAVCLHHGTVAIASGVYVFAKADLNFVAAQSAGLAVYIQNIDEGYAVDCDQVAIYCCRHNFGFYNAFDDSLYVRTIIRQREFTVNCLFNVFAEYKILNSYVLRCCVKIHITYLSFTVSN